MTVTAFTNKTSRCHPLIHSSICSVTDCYFYGAYSVKPLADWRGSFLATEACACCLRESDVVHGAFRPRIGQPQSKARMDEEASVHQAGTTADSMALAIATNEQDSSGQGTDDAKAARRHGNSQHRDRAEYGASDDGSCLLSSAARVSTFGAPISSHSEIINTLPLSFSCDTCLSLYLSSSFLIAVISFSLMPSHDGGFHLHRKRTD